jgi:hypothetical protein
VLEGERSAVEETFERISRDPRHQNVVMLLTEPSRPDNFHNGP